MAGSERKANPVVSFALVLLCSAVCFDLALVFFAYRAGLFRIVRPQPAPPVAGDEAQISRLIQSVQQEREAIDRQKEQLEREQLSMRELKRQLDVDGQSLQQRRQEIAGYMDRINASLGSMEADKEKRLQQLVKMFTAMKPDEVVPIFEKMDDRTIAEILTRMKSKVSAKILEKMNPRKAQAVAEMVKSR